MIIMKSDNDDGFENQAWFKEEVEDSREKVIKFYDSILDLALIKIGVDFPLVNL